MASRYLQIHEAARRADVETIQRELDDGVSPNAVGQDATPLHCVCRTDRDVDNGSVDSRLACLRLLVEAGADIRADPRGNGWTPTAAAVFSGLPLLVTALLDAGVDVNSCDQGGWTILHWACRLSSAEMVVLLINRGAALDRRIDAGMTPLDMALWVGQHQNIPILLRAGVDPGIPIHPLACREPNAYLQKVTAAGGIRAYERNHLNALVATFAPKFSHLLPPELVRRVVEYAFHAGDY